jgi:hypothetical protein
MSTKTTFKRIALVAVAALGLGMLSSVTVASAANTEGSLSVSQVTTARLDAPVVLKVSFPFTTDSTVGSDDTVTLQAKLLTTAPGASALDGDDFLWQDYNSANLFALPTLVPTAGGADTAADAKVTVANGTSNDRNTFVLDPSAGTANAASTSYTLTAYAAWTPNKAGTWNWVVWSDTDGSGTLNASEVSANISVVVEDTAIKTVTVTSVGGSAPTTASSTSSSTEQALVKVALTGADGLPALPKTSEYLTAKVTTGAAYIAKLNDASAATNYYAGGSQTVGETGGSTVTAINLNYYNFGINGAAYLNVKNATEEVAVITATVGGTSITGSGNQTFVDADGTVHTDGILCKVTTVAGCKESATSDPAFSIGAGTKSITYYVGGIAEEDVIAIEVADTSGLISGLIGADFSKVATASDTVMTATQVTAIGFAITAYLASFSITSASGNVVGGSYNLTAEGTGAAAQTTTVIASTATTASLQSPIASAGTLRVAPGATNSFVFRCVDDLGGRKANVTVTTTLTGRNAGLFTMPTAVTNASGEATIAYTDISTSTTNLTDSLSFAGCSTAATATVVYSSTAGLGVDTVKLTGGYYTSNVANSTITTSDINAGVDGASATTHAMTATVKDAAGNLLAGVPVVFTIAGTGCAVTSSTVTKYTGAAGTAAANVYGWLAGDCTVTATAGGKTGTAMIRFAQATASEARTISASVSGNIVTGKAVDRFGNPVSGVALYATVTAGDGYFGLTGLKTANTNTLADGTATFVVTGTGATVRISNINPADPVGTTVGQTSSRAGKVTYNADPDDDTAFTATTVGTTTTAETGVGASFAPAGVSSVSVEVAADAAAAQSQAATDAAAEATDAANAATDAANAAAEAADAATAAAQDAADAVAALSTQVSEMVNALKKQITALTNLVIKIQKKVKA